MQRVIQVIMRLFIFCYQEILTLFLKSNKGTPAYQYIFRNQNLTNKQRRQFILEILINKYDKNYKINLLLNIPKDIRIDILNSKFLRSIRDKEDRFLFTMLMQFSLFKYSPNFTQFKASRMSISKKTFNQTANCNEILMSSAICSGILSTQAVQNLYKFPLNLVAKQGTKERGWLQDKDVEGVCKLVEDNKLLRTFLDIYPVMQIIKQPHPAFGPIKPVLEKYISPKIFERFGFSDQLATINPDNFDSSLDFQNNKPKIMFWCSPQKVMHMSLAFKHEETWKLIHHPGPEEGYPADNGVKCHELASFLKHVHINIKLRFWNLMIS